MSESTSNLYHRIRAFVLRDIRQTLAGSSPVGGLAATVIEGHNHDDRYYSESEANSRFVNADGDTLTGNLAANPGVTVDGVDVSLLAASAAMNADVDMEAMRIAFNAISWAQFAIWEPFDSHTYRDMGEPGNPAYFSASTLISGDPSPGYSAKWKSVYFTNATRVWSGTSTGVGSGYLEDSAALWFDGQYQGFVLVDSATSEFAITNSTASPRRLQVSGTPASGAYTVKAGNPQYAVVFCSYLCADNGGDGDVKIEVTFDGGSHWLTVLDTTTTTNLLGGIIEIGWPGSSYAFRITLTNDGSGNSPVVYRILVCTDPSVWQ